MADDEDDGSDVVNMQDDDECDDDDDEEEEDEDSDEGLEMEDAEADDDEGEAYLDALLKKHDRRKGEIAEDEYDELADEEDEAEEIEDVDPFNFRDLQQTRLSHACGSYVYSLLLQTVFPNHARVLQGAFSLMRDSFVAEANAHQRAAVQFLADHHAFMQQVKRALVGRKETPIDGVIWSMIKMFGETTKAECVQIAAVYSGRVVPPALSTCIITDKPLCSEDEEPAAGAASKTFNKAPGWLLSFHRGGAATDTTMRLPVTKGVAILAFSYHFMKNIEKYVRGDIVARLLAYSETDGCKSSFSYITRYTTDPLSHAARFHWSYWCAKRHLCEILRIPANEADNQIV